MYENLYQKYLGNKGLELLLDVSLNTGKKA